MHREESDNELGPILIHNKVIAQIAAIAATEIKSVQRIGSSFSSKIFELFGKDAPAIKVYVDKNSQVSIEIPLIVKYGYNIDETASKVQESVRLALEKTTSLSIKNINILIRGVERGGSL